MSHQCVHPASGAFKLRGAVRRVMAGLAGEPTPRSPRYTEKFHNIYYANQGAPSVKVRASGQLADTAAAVTPPRTRRLPIHHRAH